MNKKVPQLVIASMLTLGASASAVAADTTNTTSPQTSVVNTAPVGDAGRDDTVAANTYYALNGSNSHDAEGAELTYLWMQTGGPAVDIFAPQSPNPGFVSPNVTSDQTLTFSLDVFDGKLRGETVFVNILVKADNQAPVADAGRDDTVASNTYYPLNGSNSHDPEGDELTYHWIQTAGPSVDIFAPQSPNPGFVSPNVTSNETLTFALNVFDGELYSETVFVNILVTGLNQAPIADAGRDDTVAPNTYYPLNGSNSHDPEGEGLTYHWIQTAGPSVDIFAPQSPNPGFVSPNVTTNQTLTFALNVFDGELYSETVFVNILVKVANLAPVADAGRDDTVDENAYYALNGSNSFDPEGAELTYHWIQVAGPAVDIFAPESPNPGFVAPSVDSTQTLTFALNVFDGELRSDTAMVNIVINKNNEAPIADAGDNSNMKQGGSATLNGTASYDPEGLDIASYQWTQVSGPLALLMNTTSANPTYVAPVGVSGTMVFQLQVSDGVKTSALSALPDSNVAGDDLVSVTITQNNAPIADAGQDQSKNEGSVVVMDARASFDPDRDPISYQWAQVSGTPVTFNTNSIATPSFTAPATTGGEALVFSVTITDNDSVNPKSTTDTVVVNVLDVNAPPSCDLATASPDALWPPNHKLKPVEIYGVTDNDATYNNVTIRINSVTQDEAINGKGDGNTSPDAIILPGTTLDSAMIRAERARKGDGRVYTINFTADDGFENCTGSVTVGVPAKRKSTAVDSGLTVDSTTEE